MEVFIFGREDLAVDGREWEGRIVEIQVVCTGVTGVCHDMQSVNHYHVVKLLLPPPYCV